MTDQLRYNTGKPKLHYWYSTRVALRAFSTPEVSFGPAVAAHQAIQKTAQFLHGEAYASEVVSACLALCRAEGLNPAHTYSFVCEVGAKKYARGNFRKGAPVCAYADSLLRHLEARQGGETHDPESEQPHAGHALWNAVQIYEVMDRPGSGRDDRLYHHGEFGASETK